MFDKVWVNCPNCNKLNELQSKGGPCMLKDYSLDSAPIQVLEDMVGDTNVCDGCYQEITITRSGRPTYTVRNASSCGDDQPQSKSDELEKRIQVLERELGIKTQK